MLRRVVQGSTALGVAAALAASGTATAAEVCPGVEAPTVASAAPNAALNQQFTDYGNSGDGWTGADSTYSAELPDGRTVWMFSDTFLPPIDAPTRPPEAPLVNNTFVVQDGDQLTTIHGGTDAAPEPIMKPAGYPSHWYWLGGGSVAGGGHGAELEVPLIEWQKTGPGSWDFAWVANAVASFDLDDLTTPTITPLPSSTGVAWASFTSRDGGFTYIYGVEDLGANKYMHIARTPGWGITDTERWRYYVGGDPRNPSSWSANEADSIRVLNHVSNEYSVHRLRHGLYMLLTMDTEVAFDNEVVAYFACSPTGPFTNRTTLYHAPETGLWGSYGDPDVYAYNAHAHPQLSDETHVVFSYNVNSFDATIGGDHYQDVSIYRPRFVDVQLTP